MAWRCRFLTTSQRGHVVAEKGLSEELSGAPDALVDFHTGMHCRAERESDGSYDPHCGANDADRNCDDWTIYTVESALNLAHLPPCAPCPARNSECPALEPLKPEECLPGNPAADDCAPYR